MPITMPPIFFAGTNAFCFLVMIGVMVLMRRMMQGGCCSGCCCQNFSREHREPQVTEER